MEIRSSTIYEWIRKSLEDSQRLFHSNDVIHVSEVSGCLRKAYYTRRTPMKAADIVYVIMTIGNGVHQQLQQYLAGQGWRSEVEVIWNFKRFRLTGHIDLYHPGENIVLELKTISKKPGKPYQNHLIQLNAYMKMISAAKGYLVYIARDGHVKVFNHSFDKRLWSQTIKRAFYLWYSLRDNKPPKPEQTPLCNYCPFKWKCYRGGKGDGNG